MGMTRQAGSALKVPLGNPTMAPQPMQPGNFVDPYGQSFGGMPTGTIPAYPVQYPPPNMGLMGQPPFMTGQYGAAPLPMGYHAVQHPMQSAPRNTSRQSKKSRMPAGQTNFMQQASPAYAATLPMTHTVHQVGAQRQPGMQSMNYPAMQQRADAVQQFQMQQYQQMEASMMQQLQQKQEHALLKYGNFDHAQYRQQDMQSRPEFRTY